VRHLALQRKQSDRIISFYRNSNLFFFLLLFFLGFPATGFSAQVSLAWDPNTESNLGGYYLYYGSSSGNYSQIIDVGLITNYSVTNLTDGWTYYFALTAVNTAGLESGYSNEVDYSTANPAQATLAVSKQGSGTGTVSGTGISCGSDCSEILTPGAVATLTVSPDSNSVFGGWAGACTGTNTTCTATVNGNTSVTATFNLFNPKTYSITATAGSNGSIAPAGTSAVTLGGSQVYTITPASGYQVADVRVDGTSVGALTSYTFNNVVAAHTIGATFSKKLSTSTYSLFVYKKGSGKGTVVKNLSGTVFNSGTKVSLTAAPYANSVFSGWSGACIGNSPTCTVTINANTSVTATFNLKGGAVSNNKIYLPLIIK